jgi:hypothetical protein
LSTTGHNPRIGTGWRCTVRAMSGGKPVAATVTVQIVDPPDRLAPFSLGTATSTSSTYRFKGASRDYIVWPVSVAWSAPHPACNRSNRISEEDDRRPCHSEEMTEQETPPGSATSRAEGEIELRERLIEHRPVAAQIVIGRSESMLALVAQIEKRRSTVVR